MKAHEISGCSKTKILTCNLAFGHDTVCAAHEAGFPNLSIIDIWNLMPLCCGAVLCTVGWLAASPYSTHWMPEVPNPLCCGNNNKNKNFRHSKMENNYPKRRNRRKITFSGFKNTYR